MTGLRLAIIAKRILGFWNKKPVYLEEFSKKTAEIHQLYQMRLTHITRIDQPLVLISQIQRSGGTLLSQLFDGHPECHVHPHELYIGYPRKWIWPGLNLNDDLEVWFEKLFENFIIKFFREGYQKYPREIPDERDVYPFLLLPNLQREIFRACVASTEIRSQRDVMNCYMTSYFNAWLDYQELYGSKKYVVAFVPRVNMNEESLKRFFEDYPDGKLVSIIREPKSWYVSARRHSPQQYPNVEEAIRLWKASSNAMLISKREYNDKVYLVSFENILKDTDSCMRFLAEFLGIEFNDVLLTPTFQGMKIKANSNLRVKQLGVLDEPLHRFKELTGNEIAYIDSQAGNLYQKVIEEVHQA